MVSGSVCEGKDCRGETLCVFPTIIKCLIVGQVLGLATFVITNDAMIGALVCFGVSLLYLFIG